MVSNEKPTTANLGRLARSHVPLKLIACTTEEKARGGRAALELSWLLLFLHFYYSAGAETIRTFIVMVQTVQKAVLRKLFLAWIFVSPYLLSFFKQSTRVAFHRCHIAALFATIVRQKKMQLVQFLSTLLCLVPQHVTNC